VNISEYVESIQNLIHEKVVEVTYHGFPVNPRRFETLFLNTRTRTDLHITNTELGEQAYEKACKHIQQIKNTQGETL